MPYNQREVIDFLQANSIIIGPEETRSEFEVALALGYLPLEAAGVEVETE